MDEYILNKFNNSKIVSKNGKEYDYLITKIKGVTKNDVQTFMNRISRNKNKIDDVNKTIFLSLPMLSDEKISQKDKLVIFYYIYNYHKLVLNHQMINLKDKKKFVDIEYKKPNSYYGYLNNEKYHFKILIDTDTELQKVYQNYKIMEIYDIPLPDINLDYKLSENKTIILPENRKLNDSDDKKIVFLEILNILRQFSKYKLYVVFDYWNIRKVKDRYYLLNLLNIKQVKIINIRGQIKLLRKVLKFDYNISDVNYHKTFKSYQN